MKKIFLISIVVFLLVLGAFLWRRLDVGNILFPKVIVSPVTSTPKEFILQQELEKNGFKMPQAPVLDQATIIASISGIRVLFSADQEASISVRALQLVLTRLKMEGKNFGEIDLRFGKVVLR